MSDPIIRVENLGKKYLIQHQEGRPHYRALRDVLADGLKSAAGMLRGRWPRGHTSREEFWALKDVDFEVQEGEVVGIIGRNGAGKSTLLKILSRITEPTTGRVTLNGRVASLLEVGTGFHPELTGRENVYLNGSILGMKRKEIDRRFDEIVAFAEVEKFLDTPVKRYSSGMYVRLAFAVAAHLEPEILVVDEVLAVGDAEFQKKCLGKMGEVSKGGRTVLFVSHNIASIQSLCKRIALLHQGQVQNIGAAEEVIPHYLVTSSQENTFKRAEMIKKLIGIDAANVVVMQDEDRTFLEVSTTIHSEVEATISLDIRIVDAYGIPVGFAAVGSFNHSQVVRVVPGITLIVSVHDISMLATGSYTISLDVANPTFGYHDRVEQCLRFEVHDPPRAGCYRRLIQQWGFGNVELPYVRHAVSRP